MWWHLDSALVIMVCTLAGGFDRPPIQDLLGLAGVRILSDGNLNRTAPRPSCSGDNRTGTCSQGVRWRECPVLDTAIHPLHLFVPWCVTLCILVVLGMPTVLLRSSNKEKGLRVFAGNLFQFLGLLLCSALVLEHPSVCYAFTIHACVHFLCVMDVPAYLVGGQVWWGLRYAGVLLLLSLQLLAGPAVSVVQWPSQTHHSVLACAYLCHLLGSVAPALGLSFMRCIIASARYIHVHDD